jgi:CHAT domain-containing protein
MAVRSVRDRFVVSLLALLLLVCAPAATRTAKEDARDAREALDRAEYDRAAKIIDEALQRYGASNEEDVWALRVMRGELLYNTSSAGVAKKALAPELPPNLRVSYPAVRRLILLAYADRENAVRSLEQAHAIATRVGPHALADVYVTRAIFGDAEKNATTALEYARRSRYKVAQVRAMAVLAKAFVEEGRYSEAIYWAGQALPLAERLELNKVVNQIEGNVGWAYLELGDLDVAEEHFKRAEAIATRIDNDADRARWLVQLGNIQYHRRESADAERFYRAAMARPAANPLEINYALANLAILALEARRFADARRVNAEALQRKRSANAHESVRRSLIIDARIDAAEGKLDAAEKTLREILATSTSDSTRSEAHARLGEVFGRKNQPAAAQQQFESAVDILRTKRKGLAADLRLGFYTPVTEIFSSYIDFLIDQGRDEESLAVTETSRAATLEEKLELPPLSGKLDARAIAKERNATILCYWLGRTRSYVWTVTPETIVATRLPQDISIMRVAAAYRRDLLGARGFLRQSHARGAQLYEMIIAPAVRAIPAGGRVIVIADGPLHALNFETLVVPSPQPHYWIDDAIVISAHSLQLLGRARETTPAGTPTILIVGNPPLADPAFPPLRNADREIDLVAHHFPRRTVLRGPKATPAGYRAAAPANFDIIHFVAHGVAPRQRPLNSAVILGRDASKAYKLFARDIKDQPLGARLVTISSCHGAGTRAFAGEGLVGLAWAFLGAGASNVIAALWEVDDAVAAKLMDDVYAAIANGADPAVALRDAKRKILQSRGAYEKPRYWAPFVLYAGS